MKRMFWTNKTSVEIKISQGFQKLINVKVGQSYFCGSWLKIFLNWRNWCGVGSKLLPYFLSTRCHQTWGEKVSSKNWPGQPGQHCHVQEAPLPGGKINILSCVSAQTWNVFRIYLNVRVCVRARAPGVSVPGVQGGDSGVGGGWVTPFEAAAGGGHQRAGARLQAVLQQPPAAAPAVTPVHQ